MKEMRIGVVCQPVHPTRAEIEKAINEHFEKQTKDGMSRPPQKPGIMKHEPNRKTCDDRDYNQKPEENLRKM